jgi:hypothetical protein
LLSFPEACGGARFYAEHVGLVNSLYAQFGFCIRHLFAVTEASLQ